MKLNEECRFGVREDAACLSSLTPAGSDYFGLSFAILRT